MASVRDFEPESFILEKYVEKMSQNDPNVGLGPLSKSKIKPFDPRALLDVFQHSIHMLAEVSERNQRRVEKLEHVCTRQEMEHNGRIRELEGTYQESFSEFQMLEDRITYVATKVVHLGDQLESSNNRRMRAVEAIELMKYLDEFKTRARPNLPVFTDPGRKLEAAALINKLHSLTAELPNSDAYTKVRTNIYEKYAETEQLLVNEFIESLRSLDSRRMKQYAAALQPFSRGAGQVVSEYIHHNIPVQKFPSTELMVEHVEKLCKKVHTQVVDIFDNPDVVMAKFVQSLLDRVLQKHIDDELLPLQQSTDRRDRYLKRLYELYGKMMELQGKLSTYEMSIDTTFLAKLVRVSLFHKYLTSYAVMEAKHLATVSSRTLEDFCDRMGITRRTIGVGRASSSTSSGSMNEETFVSMEVCTNILHEAKESVRRASALLMDKELSVLIRELYFVVLDKLCTEHFHTALEIAQSSDPKSSPTGLFCLVVGQVNSNMHLIEKLYRDTVVPCISYPPEATKCLEKKREVTQRLESKIEAGIERSLTGMVGSVKSYLAAYQKKTDYRPEDMGVPQQTEACHKVVSYVMECRRVLDQSLDGKNLEVVLLEFGIRLQRVIFEHIQQFVISENGAMSIICDINEYRKAIKEFNNPFLDELFGSLQALCNIFIVKHENLPQVCSEEPYTSFDRNVLSSLVALRADYKTNKLAKLFA